MCCFAQPVERVGKTRIFTRLTGEGSQFIAYQMEYESKTKNAMILPIPSAPNPTERLARFLDLKDNNGFFDQLHRAFPTPVPPAGSDSIASSRSGAVANSVKLAVKEVGDFIASVVPTLADFSRLDPQFVIAPDVWKQIPEYADYSFIVFQLEKLSGKPHPMAFEFESRLKEELFFPTVHIHDGEVHKREHFDHELYCQHAAFDAVVGKYTRSTDKKTGLVRSKGPAGNYVNAEKSKGLIEPNLLLHRKRMRGNLTNRDVLVRATGDPLKISAISNPSRWWTVGGLLGASMLPLGWVIRRRQFLAKNSVETPETK